MSQPAAATTAEIVAVLGPIDEVVFTDILRTGASAAEAQEAFTRLEADDAVGPDARARRRGAGRRGNGDPGGRADRAGRRLRGKEHA